MATRARTPPASKESAGDDFPVGAALPAGALVEFGDDDEPEQTATDRVLETLAGVGADERAVLKVHQVDSSGKESWCADYAPHDFETGGLEMLRGQWGAGVYSLRLYGTRNGRYGILTRAQVKIKEKAASPAPAGGDTSGLALVLAQLAEGQRTLAEALAHRPAPVDPVESMKSTLALMTTMREAFGMTAPVAEKKSSIAEMVDAIKELRSASELVNPHEGNDDSLTGMVKSILPMIGQVMEQRRADAAAPAVPNPQFPPIGMLPIDAGTSIGGDNQPGDTVAFPATTGGNEMLGISAEAIAAIKLRAYVATLLAMAAGNIDSEVGAELVAEKLPDEMLDLLELPNWWTLFVGQVPQATPYEQWFTKVRDRALVMLAEDGEETEGGVHVPGAETAAAAGGE